MSANLISVLLEPLHLKFRVFEGWRVEPGVFKRSAFVVGSQRWMDKI
jgi:hypothetical protein